MKNNKLIIIGIILISILMVIKIDPFKNTNNIKEKNIGDENYDKYLTLVNKENTIGLKDKPSNLVEVKILFLDNCIDEEKNMDKEAAEAVEQLFEGAKKENINFIGTSAYRSYKTQVKIFNKNIKDKGLEYTKNYVAMPGQSEHQTGLAIDVTNENRYFTKETKEAQWLANNAHKYGFIIRYPEGKEDITGYNYEPWHIRYVGRKVAKEIHKQSITLEEYIDNMV